MSKRIRHTVTTPADCKEVKRLFDPNAFLFSYIFAAAKLTNKLLQLYFLINIGGRRKFRLPTDLILGEDI